MYDFSYMPQKRASYGNYFIINKSLTIETKIIGYKNQGECVLIFVRVDNGICFSALIDCYMTNSIDKVSEILDMYHVQNLNFLCWTHPDLDHSKGLKKVFEKYVDKKTQIWIPEGIEAHEIECSKEVQELFSMLKECVIDYSKGYSVYTASDVKELSCYDTYCFAKGLNEYVLSIMGYTPNSKLIRRQNYLNQFIKNDRSIFCVFRLGEVRIFLTGDIENQTIQMLPKGVDSHAHILKIPHHGSETSIEMIDVCSEGCDVACSTVYRMGKSRLPNDEVMKQYSLGSKLLYCTGGQDQEQEKYEYGIVTVYTDVLNNLYEVKMEGNARLLG